MARYDNAKIDCDHGRQKDGNKKWQRIVKHLRDVRAPKHPAEGGAMSANPRVSLYIPCYNVERFIARCVEAVLVQSYPVDEILIIDDGSIDQTVKLAEKYPVKVICHPQNLGLAAARNTGLKNARNELVASLDADCVADRDWLATLVDEMNTDKIAATGGRLVETVLESLADKWRRAHMTQDWGEKRQQNPSFMYGNNTLVRKHAVAKVGWYDESHRTNGEDMDMSRRLMAAGYTCVYQPRAVVSHLRQDSLRSILDTYWRWWKFGTNAHVRNITLMGAIVDIVGGHILRSFKRVLWRDLCRGNWELLGIDVLLPAYMIGRYMGLIFSRMKQKHAVARIR